MADSEQLRMDAALAALDDAPGEATPAESTPTTEGPAPTSPPGPNATPAADAAPDPKVDERARALHQQADAQDDDAKLLEELAARKAKREERVAVESAVERAARLERELNDLRAQSSVRPADRAVEFMADPIGAVARHMGVDPIEFYERFKQAAANPNAPKPQPQTRQPEAPKPDPRLDQVVGWVQTQAEREAQRAAVQITDSMEVLGALEPQDRIEEMLADKAKLERLGHDITDGNGNTDLRLLARVTEARLKRIADAKAARTKPTDGAPTEAKAKTPPTTDGASPPAQPATLTNDLAAQSSGKRRLLTPQERMEAALRELG